MRQVEESGRTVDEAVARALAALGVSKDDVQVEVLEAGARGMLGLGARDARVLVTLKAGPADLTRGLAEQLFRAMGYAPTVVAEAREDGIYLDVRGRDLGALIGRHGATLDAIDLLLGLMARRTGGKVRVVVDVEGYRTRRQRALEDLARSVAQQVHREQRTVTLDPMGPRERRVIHTTLSENPDVLTYSQGDGSQRRVVVALRGHGVPPAPPRTDDDLSDE